MKSWRPLAFFLGHRLIGSHLGEYYREFHALRQTTAEELNRLAQARLQALLQQARKRIPFYRKRVGNGAAALPDFPILTKPDLIEHFTELMSPELAKEHARGTKPRGYSWVEVKTGGTSGVPTTLIHDREFRDRGRASRLFSQYLCGFPLGTPYYMLWGSMTDINAPREVLTKRILNGLLNVRVLNAFRMDAERMRGYLRRIQQSKIEHLMAYVDAAEQLACFAQAHDLKTKPFTSVMACAGTVTPDARERIRSVFDARVHNKYGSRDCSDIACECPLGGLHWFSHHVWLEVVDEQGRALPPGETGRLLVTLLSNHHFPLIRYDIGDQGSLSDESCRCGMPFPLLANLEGRAVEFVTDLAGTRLTPVYLRHLIGVVHNPENRLQRFQFNQLAQGRYELLLEVAADDRESYRRESLPAIERDLVTVLGAQARIEVKFADRLTESQSGKFLYVRNLMAARGQGEA